MAERRFSGEQKCGHCANSAPMEIVAKYSKVKEHSDDSIRPSPVWWNEGDVFELLLCPACEQLTLRCYYYHDMAQNPDDIELRVLYPLGNPTPRGLPETIDKDYQAALNVRTVSANAYGVLLRRVLELVCEDRQATGKFLHHKLRDLAKKGEIPGKLVAVAESLKNLGNVGAHPTLGELTPAELPILDGLCRAILEYVYSAPFMADQAEQRLKALQDRRRKDDD